MSHFSNRQFANSPIRSSSGFTFLELLIVVSLIAVVGMLAVPVYQGFQIRQQLDTASQELLQTLRLAQNRAMAGDGGAPVGVHLTSNRAMLFPGAAYAGQTDDVLVDLPPTVRLTNWTLSGGGDDVVFNQLAGVTANSGTITVAAPDLNEQVVIAINGAGVAELQ